jgi:site-specific DNA recombinase
MAAQLAPVPDVPPRAVAYIRVSKERDETISPELQLTAITDHCARMGYVLVEPLIDLDMTGRFWKRRKVEKAVAMIEAGTVDVVVVWKLSRVARNRLDWNIAVDRVESAGGRLESATEPLDTTTSSGRFARGMLAEVAAFESERIGDGWKETHAKRVRDGLPATGKPRWGYRTEGGRFVPDPVTEPVLASLYRRYVAGESVYALVRWLNAEGFRTSPGYSKRGPGLWSDRSLRRALDSGFAAGLIRVGGAQSRGVHEPLISEAEWSAYLTARADRRVVRSAERSPYLLSGLVRCACGSGMTGGQFGSARQPKYRCSRAKESGTHAGGYVMMRVVEAEVLRWLETIASSVEAETEAAAASRVKADRRRRDAKALHREVAALDAQLTRLTVQLAKEVIPESAYVSARDEIEGQKAGLLERVRLAEADAARVAVRGGARKLLDDWEMLSVELRRAELRKWISHIDVTSGRPRATVGITPTWAGESRH